MKDMRKLMSTYLSSYQWQPLAAERRRILELVADVLEAPVEEEQRNSDNLLGMIHYHLDLTRDYDGRKSEAAAADEVGEAPSAAALEVANDEFKESIGRTGAP